MFNLFGKEKKNIDTSIFLLLSAVLLILLATSIAHASITDKRVETVNWFYGNTYCYTRHIDTDSILIPTWNGSATLVGIYRIDRVNITVNYSIPIFDCGVVDNTTQCNDTGKTENQTYVYEQVNRTTVKSPSKDLASISLVSSQILAKTDSSIKVTAGEYQFCFKAAGHVGGHIEYIAIDTARNTIDTCKSTLYNITNVEIVIAAVVILGVLMIGLVKRA
jgi:hypothetical protein